MLLIERPNKPHEEAPIPMNKKIVCILMYSLIMPTSADDNAVVPTTPICDTENKRPWYLLGACNWIIEVLLTMIIGIPIP